MTGDFTSLYPGEARIDVRGRPARVLADQIRSIDQARLRARIGSVSPAELREVEAAVLITLGLSPP